MALIRQWKCNSGVTLNGGDVSNWVDTVVASELLQATGSKQPTQITDANGWKPLRFAGVEEMFLAGTSELDYTTGIMTVVACIRRHDGVPINVICGKGTEGNNTQWQTYFQGGGNGSMTSQNAQATNEYRYRTTNTGRFTSNTLQVAGSSVNFTGPTVKVYYDGNEDTTNAMVSNGSFTTTTNAKKFGVGNLESGTSFGRFDLYELRLYDSLPDMAALYTEIYGLYNARAASSSVSTISRLLHGSM